MAGAYSFISSSVLAVLFLTAGAAAGPAALPTTLPTGFSPFRPLVHLPDGQDQAVLQLKRIDNLLLAEVKVNALETGLFIIDTGANATFLDASFAKKVNARPAAPMQVTTTTSHLDVGLVDITGMDIGPVHVDRTLVVAADLSEIGKLLGIPLAGMLGCDVLDKQPFTVDFRAATLTLYNPGRFVPPAGESFRLSKYHAAPKIHVQGTVQGGTTGWFRIDTGDLSRLALHTPYIDLNPGMLEPAHRVMGQTTDLAGGKLCKTTPVAAFAALGRTWHNVRVTIRSSDSQSADGPQAAGEIGLRLIGDGRLTFDLQHETIWAAWPGPETTDQMLQRLERADRSELGKTSPLMRAAGAGRLDVVEALLAHGADVNAVSTIGWMPLQFAVSGENVDVVKTLLKHGARVNAVFEKEGSVPLMDAAALGNLEIVRALLESSADVKPIDLFGQTALYIAVMADYPDIADALLKAGSDPNMAASSGITPLMAAAATGDIHLVELLIAHGARIDGKDRNDATALHASAYSNNPRIVAFLLDRGSSLNGSDRDGRTAMMFAVMQQNALVVQLLLQRGADATLRNTKGKTASDLALESGDGESFKLIYFADPKNQPAKHP